MLLNCTILHYTLLYYTAFFYIIQNILFVMYHVIIPHSAGLLSCQIFILRSIMLLACHAKLYSILSITLFQTIVKQDDSA